MLLGIAQEQHPDRCRLLAQWKGFAWPILHDPINVLGSSAVPLFVAVDEHGIVRDTKPRLETLERDFLSKSFANDAKEDELRWLTPTFAPGETNPDFASLRHRAENEGRSVAWRDLGDALVLWGGEKQLNAAIDAYTRAAKLDPNEAATLFRLGVCYRRRYDSLLRQPGDFQVAVDYWGRALQSNPNQYIWRRRIQQYGPRLDKPYAFYDWVAQAEKEIAARGDKPVLLAVRPGGAEIAHPMKIFPAQPVESRSPDPQGKVRRDEQGLIRAETTIVPSRPRQTQAVRIHLVLRPEVKLKAHWNNEAEPLRLWIDAPEGWRVTEHLLVSPSVKQAVTEEERALDFEATVPMGAEGKVRLRAYALYNVCDDASGQCQFLRLDIPIEVPIEK